MGLESCVSNKLPHVADAMGLWTTLRSKDPYPQDLQLNSLRLNSGSDGTGALLSVRGLALTRLSRDLVVSEPLSSRWNNDRWGGK